MRQCLSNLCTIPVAAVALRVEQFQSGSSFNVGSLVTHASQSLAVFITIVGRQLMHNNSPTAHNGYSYVCSYTLYITIAIAIVNQNWIIKVAS